MSTYDEAIYYLFNQRPAYERQGATGYKPGLSTTLALDEYYGNPHKNYKIIHVAGTNGKGSVSSLIAAVLQSQGYKTGLYTSPHFVDFAERIKVNGTPIPHDRVVEFVDSYRLSNIEVDPSFFELTTLLAFKYFEECNVDYAVVEVGLGGRLDSTNIVTPQLSIITNISIDHTEFLGNTPVEIAAEKCGIIKKEVPVIVGEVEDEVRKVVIDKAQKNESPITFVQDKGIITNYFQDKGFSIIETHKSNKLKCQLTGDYQKYNIAIVLEAIEQLRSQGVSISDEAVQYGLAHVCDITSLRGRWSGIRNNPLVLCDSAHNVAGIKAVLQQLRHYQFAKLRMVVGFMSDKDLEHILPLLPTEAEYYFTQASMSRALNSSALEQMGQRCGLTGACYPTVVEAYQAALSQAQTNDFIYVGGSMYVLSELFSYIDSLNQ